MAHSKPEEHLGTASNSTCPLKGGRYRFQQAGRPSAGRVNLKDLHVSYRGHVTKHPKGPMTQIEGMYPKP